MKFLTLKTIALFMCAYIAGILVAYDDTNTTFYLGCGLCIVCGIIMRDISTNHK